jgi:tRNA (adenine37-N6)-methyltransferase
VIEFTSIGLLHTPFLSPDDMPIQSARSTAQGTAEIFDIYRDGLDGIEEFSHLYLIYHLHQAPAEAPLHVRPFLDDREHGIFATRFPHRPNPIGLSIVKILRVEGACIHFSGADMLDGTPLLDIKPYIPEFDIFEVEKTGWYAHRKYK